MRGGVWGRRHGRVTAPTAAQRHSRRPTTNGIENPLDFRRLEGSHLRVRTWRSACPHIVRTLGRVCGRPLREDDMRTNGQIAASMLLAAFAAVGCSKPFEEPEKKTQQQPPVSAPATAIAVPTSGNVATKSTGPVSFADADAAYQSKSYTEATTLFEQYTTARPGNAWGHFMLGLSAWKSGDLTKAEGAFEEALKIDPNHVKGLVNLSRVLIDQRRYDEALVRLTHANEVDASSVD